ncbi:hypothetical protein IV203_021387 [Nitzschia inconspicua]|uniref:Uncharacterized protein n=1 Tax=Nitzschia inconspicua TaxID=303405 RepID=A0A9K3KGU2_9STRA|nr:hypothetical protein IV203_021387 [Nitzschia inconspicua]
MQLSNKTLVVVLAAALLAILSTTLKLRSLSRESNVANVLSLGRMAVVRPVSPHDVESLMRSFDIWDDKKFPPCNPISRGNSNDLILSFSRTTDETRALTAQVVEAFNRTSGWGHCFSNLFVIDCKLSHGDDKYDESVQESDYMWVNGPNTQAIKDAGYETFYYMEADSYPMKKGWLDLLLEEIHQKKPFGILGSKYKGSAWSAFVDRMPLALVEHINGNAIYNVSDKLLDMMLEELEYEQEGPYNAVAYDYRLSQMYFEASKNVSSVFPFPKLLERNKNKQRLVSKTSKFQGWWKKLGYDGFFCQSHVIGNFGLNGYFENIGSTTTIVHGKQYNPMRRFQKGSTTKPKNGDEQQRGRQLRKKCPKYHPNCISKRSRRVKLPPKEKKAVKTPVKKTKKAKTNTILI